MLVNPKVGDVVKLVSGGPDMTIAEIYEIENDNKSFRLFSSGKKSKKVLRVQCKWHSYAGIETYHFDPALLVSIGTL